MKPVKMEGNNGGSEVHNGKGKGKAEAEEKKKPFLKPPYDDTKPHLRDPILRSDPIGTEEVVLRLPPFPVKKLES